MARSGWREDGAATRQTILETAGHLFAEKGYGRTTGKEIAEQAGTNSAAVNYYFGGIEGLYTEVLVEAHHRLLAYEYLKQVTEAPGDPREKLRIFLESVLCSILGPMSASWPFRVLGREILMPSPVFSVFQSREILPKKQLAFQLISQILGVSPDHPAVGRCFFNILAPSALMLLANTQMLSEVIPQHSFADKDAVIRHFQSFIIGGIEAVAREEASCADKSGEGVSPSLRHPFPPPSFTRQKEE